MTVAPCSVDLSLAMLLGHGDLTGHPWVRRTLVLVLEGSCALSRVLGVNAILWDSPYGILVGPSSRVGDIGDANRRAFSVFSD